MANNPFLTGQGLGMPAQPAQPASATSQVPVSGVAPGQVAQPPAQQPAPVPGTPGGQQPQAPNPWKAILSIIYQDELSKLDNNAIK